MALHYNYKECNLDGVPDHVITEMIYCTMVIEIGHFTEENIKEVFYRISIAEMFNGCPFHFEPKTFKSILADMDLLKKFFFCSVCNTNLLLVNLQTQLTYH